MHEIGHILGLNHPDEMSTVAGYPVGNNSYHVHLASNDGMEPFSKPNFPADVCSNPWAHVRTGVWPGAEDIDAVVSLVPFAVETVLVQLQAALSVKIAAASLRRHQGQGRSWTRQQQREEHEQRFHHFLHSGEAQERRRRRRRKAPWYPP